MGSVAIGRLGEGAEDDRSAGVLGRLRRLIHSELLGVEAAPHSTRGRLDSVGLTHDSGSSEFATRSPVRNVEDLIGRSLAFYEVPTAEPEVFVVCRVVHGFAFLSTPKGERQVSLVQLREWNPEAFSKLNVDFLEELQHVYTRAQEGVNFTHHGRFAGLSETEGLAKVEVYLKAFAKGDRKGDAIRISPTTLEIPMDRLLPRSRTSSGDIDSEGGLENSLNEATLPLQTPVTFEQEGQTLLGRVVESLDESNGFIRVVVRGLTEDGLVDERVYSLTPQVVRPFHAEAFSHLAETHLGKLVRCQMEGGQVVAEVCNISMDGRQLLVALKVSREVDHFPERRGLWVNADAVELVDVASNEAVDHILEYVFADQDVYAMFHESLFSQTVDGKVVSIIPTTRDELMPFLKRKLIILNDKDPARPQRYTVRVRDVLGLESYLAGYFPRPAYKLGDAMQFVWGKDKALDGMVTDIEGTTLEVLCTKGEYEESIFVVSAVSQTVLRAKDFVVSDPDIDMDEPGTLPDAAESNKSSDNDKPKAAVALSNHELFKELTEEKLRQGFTILESNPEALGSASATDDLSEDDLAVFGALAADPDEAF